MEHNKSIIESVGLSIAEPLQTGSMCRLPIGTKFGMRQWASDLCLQA